MDRIFRFSQTHCDWPGTDAEAKMILGGKGAGLVKMCRAEMPVPPGFTITTQVCNEFRKQAVSDAAYADLFLSKLMAEVMEHDKELRIQMGFTPLVSVRSGAPVSMPGMMDTILNVGLTDHTLEAWSQRIGHRAALDSYRRLIQMLGATAYNVPTVLFDEHLEDIKEITGVTEDKDLSEDALVALIERYKMVFQAVTQQEFPQTREEQLRAATRAVFDSWMNERAVEYRKINKIDEAMGTAVNIQAMVFGNMGESSGSGVGFTRDPSTGVNKIMAEYLTNAQGEDVVAGIRTPESLDIGLAEDDATKNLWKLELLDLCNKLEDMYDDMVDLEFTVQEGKLWLLQSRTGKRSARAAFKIAVDLVQSGVISKETALSRITPEQFKIVRRPTIDPKFETPADLTGLPACPGVVTGVPVFSAHDAINCKEPCILVTHETTPDDIAGMNAAVGILTQTGGATSHAAVVARAMDKACVVGCTVLNLTDLKAGIHDKPGQKVTIDGSTGRVWFDIDVPVIDSSDAPEVRFVMDWCLESKQWIEATPVDLGEDRPHMIMAAHWWGNEDVLTAILDGLQELPNREHVFLDLRGPSDFVPECDHDLANCFGVSEAGVEDQFRSALRIALHSQAEKLAGLNVLNPGSISGLKQAGYTVFEAGSETMPVGVPGDYAAFSALGR